MHKNLISTKSTEFSNQLFLLPYFNEVQRLMRRTHKYCGVEPKVSMITGPSHCGKTAATKYYMNTYNDNACNASTEDFTASPIIYVQVTANVTVAGLLVNLLASMGVTNAKATEKITSLQTKVIEKLILYKIELVIIDEIQHLLPKNGDIKTQNIADQIKTLINETLIPFILCGMPDAKKLLQPSAIQYAKGEVRKHVDDTQRMQLVNRSLKGVDFKPYRFQKHDGSAWIDILKSYMKLFSALDIPIIDLTTKSTPERVWLASNGIIGRVKYIFIEAIELFEESKGNYLKIDLTLLAKSYDYVAAWTEDEGDSPNNPFTCNTRKMNTLLAMEIEESV